MRGDVIKYWDGYDAQLAEAYTCQTGVFPPEDIDRPFYSITKTGLVTAKFGYAWDFATGAIDTDDIKRASLIHDILYQAIGEGYLPRVFREDADKELRKICREDGMSLIRSWYVYRAVRTFGCLFGDTPPEIHTAP